MSIAYRAYQKLLQQPLGLIIIATAAYGLFKFPYRFINHDFTLSLSLMGLMLAPLLFLAAYQIRFLWASILSIWVLQFSIVAFLINLNFGSSVYHLAALSTSALMIYACARLFARLSVLDRLFQFLDLPLESSHRSQLAQIIIWGTTVSALFALFANTGLALTGQGELFNLLSLAILFYYFVWLCRSHQSILHSYIAISLPPIIVFAVYVYLNTIPWLGSSGGLGRLYHQIYPALIFCSFSLLYALIALALGKWRLRLLKLYTEPFAATAISMGLIALILAYPVAQFWHVWQTMLIFAIAGSGILFANHIIRIPALSIIAISALFLSLIQLHGFLFYDSFRLFWWFEPVHHDALLLIAGFSAGLAVIAEVVKKYSYWNDLYQIPLRLLSSAGLIITASLVFLPHAGLFYLSPWIILIMTLGLIALLSPLKQRQHITGITTLIGLSLCAYLWADIYSIYTILSLIPFWAFFLLLSADLLIPRLNKKFATYALYTYSWPYAGLLLMFIGLYQAQWWYSFLLATYAYIMLRQTRIFYMPYLAGLILSFALFQLAFDYSGIYPDSNAFINLSGISLFAFFVLISINLLILLASILNKWQSQLDIFFHKQSRLIATSLEHLSLLYLAIICASVLYYQLNYAYNLVPIPLHFDAIQVSFFNLVLLATSGHLAWRTGNRLNSHMLLLTGLLLVLGLWPLFFNQGSNFAISFTIWAALVLTFIKIDSQSKLQEVLQGWLAPSCIIAILFNLTYLSQQSYMLAINLFLQLLLCLAITRKLQNQTWAHISSLVGVLCVHSFVLVWFPGRYYAADLANLSLAMSILVWMVYLFHIRSTKESLFHTERYLALVSFHIIALVEWCLHLFNWWDYSFLGGNTNGTEYLLALLAVLSLASVTIVHAARQQKGPKRRPWVYAAGLQVALAAIYTRLMILGFAPLGVWDTASLMVAAYISLLMMNLVRSKALYRITSVLPLVAIATVPFQLASYHASFTLFLAGVLYLVLNRGQGPKWQYYAGLIAINAAVYLWVPNWAESSQLFQIYLIPAALSVLILAHIHRKELKSNTLNSLRLGASSILYAAATLDVFVRAEWSIFTLALFISFIGIIFGIALRIRAFLYSGLAFMVLNVIGQLIQFYPEQALAKAITLMVLGAIITFGMIWFNLKREQIMQKIGALRATLDTWE